MANRDTRIRIAARPVLSYHPAVLDKIKAFVARDAVQVVLFWSARIIALTLTIYLAASLLPAVVQMLSDSNNLAQALVVLVMFIAFYAFLVSPLIVMTKNFLRANQKQAGVTDAMLLKSHKSASYIPKGVPEVVKPLIVWRAEMSGDTSAEGIQRASAAVMERYSGGIRPNDVAYELAVHEAGHATVSLALGRAVVSIERGHREGATYSLAQTAAPRAKDVWDDLVVTVAGAQAEKLWSSYQLMYVTNSKDDREECVGYINALLFAGWTPNEETSLSYDGILFAAQNEARRILTDYQPLHDELTQLVKENGVVDSPLIIEVARKHLRS